MRLFVCLEKHDALSVTNGPGGRQATGTRRGPQGVWVTGYRPGRRKGPGREGRDTGREIVRIVEQENVVGKVGVQDWVDGMSNWMGVFGTVVESKQGFFRRREWVSGMGEEGYLSGQKVSRRTKDP